MSRRMRYRLKCWSMSTVGRRYEMVRREQRSSAGVNASAIYAKFKPSQGRAGRNLAAHRPAAFPAVNAFPALSIHQPSLSPAAVVASVAAASLAARRHASTWHAWYRALKRRSIHGILSHAQLRGVFITGFGKITPLYRAFAKQRSYRPFINDV